MAASEATAAVATKDIDAPGGDCCTGLLPPTDGAVMIERGCKACMRPAAAVGEDPPSGAAATARGVGLPAVDTLGSENAAAGDAWDLLWMARGEEGVAEEERLVVRGSTAPRMATWGPDCSAIRLDPSFSSLEAEGAEKELEIASGCHKGAESPVPTSSRAPEDEGKGCSWKEVSGELGKGSARYPEAPSVALEVADSRASDDGWKLARPSERFTGDSSTQSSASGLSSRGRNPPSPLGGGGEGLEGCITGRIGKGPWGGGLQEVWWRGLCRAAARSGSPLDTLIDCCVGLDDLEALGVSVAGSDV